jgi:hypothetical protein
MTPNAPNGYTTGWLQIGPQNSSWCHVLTNMPQFYFNQSIYVHSSYLASGVGLISSYNTDNLVLGTGSGSSYIERMRVLNSNGSVGIGTTAPLAQLHVKGPASGFLISGQNLDPRNYLLTNYSLGGTGQLLLGWNYTGGGGEADFIQNRGTAANTGGFNFYDYSNTGNVVTTLMSLSGSGDANITGTLTLGADAANNWTTASGSPYTQATSSGSWAVPLIIPNGSAIRTASTSSSGLQRYLGFGMVDGPSYTSSTTGWYWIVQGNTGTAAGCPPNAPAAPGTGTSAAYPMALTLDVNGNATLTVSQNGWCDFVFDSSYSPMSIEEKEKYYKINKHLPGIESAEVIDNKGLSINTNMKGMMQNIEEDRLDITALYKVIKQQQEEIELLKKKVETLSK